ncbi:MAG TPA: lipoyl(octanoyl) transferase LipB [Gemmataceae bacterium]|jgi:lipoyl(octanoyl) transferase|nr:lipoyl(octanoyl) transferase LipB [Gemmataceae bacterium]
MGLELPTTAVLQAYLLGLVDFESALAFQRRLVYDVAGDRSSAALVLCEHPPVITVGRMGSRRHILCEPEELRSRRWRVCWVNRGGGCLLHVPGQLAVYPVLALDQLGLGLQAYLDRLQETLVAVLDDFGVRGQTRPGRPGVWVGSRLIAGTGIAVRDWVTYYGAALNVNPELHSFRLVHSGGDEPMTSLVRERRGPLRPALVRERLLEHFTDRFGFSRTALFSDHPALNRRTSADALATRP